MSFAKRTFKALVAMIYVAIVRKPIRSPHGYRSIADGTRIWETQISP